jgi:hypothetical protein
MRRRVAAKISPFTLNHIGVIRSSRRSIDQNPTTFNPFLVISRPLLRDSRSDQGAYQSTNNTASPGA